VWVVVVGGRNLLSHGSTALLLSLAVEHPQASPSICATMSQVKVVSQSCLELHLLSCTLQSLFMHAVLCRHVHSSCDCQAVAIPSFHPMKHTTPAQTPIFPFPAARLTSLSTLLSGRLVGWVRAQASARQAGRLETCLALWATSPTGGGGEREGRGACNLCHMPFNTLR
jgi:hypothetical protein